MAQDSYEWPTMACFSEKCVDPGTLEKERKREREREREEKRGCEGRKRGEEGKKRRCHFFSKSFVLYHQQYR